MGIGCVFQVAAVRQVVAHELGSPYERLKLIADGKALEDERSSTPLTVKFVDGGTCGFMSFGMFERKFGWTMRG